MWMIYVERDGEAEWLVAPNGQKFVIGTEKLEDFLLKLRARGFQAFGKLIQESVPT